MPSATTNLRIEKQDGGSNNNTWGTDHLNVNEDLTDEAIAGVLTLTMTSNHTLTNTDYVSNQARNATYNLTGGDATYIVTIPSVKARKVVRNASGYDQSVKTSGGSAVTVRNGTVVSLICDGTNCYLDDLTLDQIKAAAGNVSLNSNKLTDVDDPTLAQDAATKNYVDTRKVSDFIAPNVSVSWGSQKLTSLANGTASGDAVNYGQLTAAVWNSQNIMPGSAAGQVVLWNGSTFLAGALDLADNDARTGLLPKANGGTGAGTDAGVRQSVIFSTTVADALKVLRVAADGMDYELVTLTTGTPVISKSGNYTVVTGDAGKLIECTATLTLTLPAAATAGDGFRFLVRMTIAYGVVTIDPNGAELVDGLATVAAYVGDSVFEVICNGSNWRTTRLKGEIYLGSTTIGSAVSSIDFETGFTDAEFADALVRFYGMSHNDGGIQYPICRLKKSGSYATTNYVGNYINYASNSVASSTSNVTGNSGLPLSLNNLASVLVTGFVEVLGFQQSTHARQSVMVRSKASDGSYTGIQLDGTTSVDAAIQGLRFMSTGSNLDAGVFHQSMRRV